MGHATASV